jgi:hypothetical protein
MTSKRILLSVISLGLAASGVHARSRDVQTVPAPLTLAFAKSEVTLMVGQTIDARPPVFATFRDAPQKQVDVRTLVTFGGSARLPFSPHADDVGKTFTIVANLQGVAATMAVKVKEAGLLRFGFQYGSMPVKVGQTLQRPPVLGVFSNEPDKTVDLSARVLYDGFKDFPFTPSFEQAGKSYFLKATLAGRTTQVVIQVAPLTVIGFGFLDSSERTINVGDRFDAPEINVEYEEFKGKPQEIGKSVIWSGVPLPFIPTPKQAGRTFTLTATLGGVSRHVKINVTGTPVPDNPLEEIAGDWRLEGSFTDKAKNPPDEKASSNATLTLTRVSAAAAAKLLEDGFASPMRFDCTKNLSAPPVMFTGQLKFDNSALFAVAACLNGNTVEGLFIKDAASHFAADGWFEILPLDAVGHWELGKKWNNYFNWTAKKVVK